MIPYYVIFFSSFRNQFMDILGSAQTLAAHKAVLKTFNFVKPKDIDPLERYLWALSLGKKPKVEFVKGNLLFEYFFITFPKDTIILRSIRKF